jgi:hypothetical protein
MACETCGHDGEGACHCQHASLLGFLSDFRSGTATPPAAEETADLFPARPGIANAGPSPWDEYALAPAARPDRDEAPPAQSSPVWEAAPAQSSPVWDEHALAQSSPVWEASPAQSSPVWEAPAAQPSPVWEAPPAHTPPDWALPARPWPWKEAAVFVAVLLVAGVVLFAVTRSGSSGFASKPGAQILADSVASARRAGSAHLEATFLDSGKPVQASADVSPDGGTMTETFGSESGNLMIIGKSVFLRASYGFLVGVAGVSSDAASRLEEKWLEVPDGGMASAQFTGPRVIEDLIDLGEPIQKLSDTDSSVVSLSGVIPNVPDNQGSGGGDTATLEISQAAPHYPVSIAFSDPRSGSVEFRFSRWGEQVSLIAPTGAIRLPSASGSTQAD